MELPAASHYQHLNLHQDGTQALRSLLNMINAATATIDICTFMFARDNLGDEIAQNLSQKARQGIRVRLLVDGLGTYLGHTHFTQLQEAGVHVVFFILPLRSSLYGRSNLRNHRKMVITDHHWLWCGGRNFATEYFAGDAQNSPENKAWIDLTFDLQGALAQQAQQQFEQDWAFATRHDSPLPLRGVQDAQAEAPLAQLIPSGPDQADDTLYTLLVSGFFNSSQRILAVTPYFVPDPTLLMSLALAARRGVKVDLLIPRKSNHRLADLARHRALRELAAAGANVWLCPGMIHAKAIVIDEQLALAGSANLDQRSLFLNYELMVAFYSPGDIAHFAEWMENQRIGAVLYRAKTPTMMREIAEGLLLWLAFQL
jgi:cardiolipin synthase